MPGQCRIVYRLLTANLPPIYNLTYFSGASVCLRNTTARGFLSQTLTFPAAKRSVVSITQRTACTRASVVGNSRLNLQRLRLTALFQGRLRSRLTARPTFTAPEFFRGRCADACASRSTFTCGLRARRQPPRTRTRSERGQTASFHPNGGSLLDQAATLRGAT